MGASQIIISRSEALLAMIPGDILLTLDRGGRGLPQAASRAVSCIIGFLTRKQAPRDALRYSHVEICYQAATAGPDGVLDGPVMLSAEPFGVTGLSVMRYASKVHKRVDVFRMEDLTAEQVGMLVRWCSSLAIRRPKYDWSGVAHFLFPRAGQDQSKMFCSEVLVTVLRGSGIKIWEGAPPHEIVPIELGLALATRAHTRKILTI